MAKRQQWLVAIVIAAVVSGAVVRTLAAPQAPAAQNGDVLPALLTEVRGLRAAMEQMASAGPRVQLFVARLQLEETRINNRIRRLDGIRDELAKTQSEIDSAVDQQRRFEKALTDDPHRPGARS